jgi:hypothetical protein
MTRLLRMAAALCLCAAIFPGASASTAQPLEAGKGLIIFHVLQRCYEGHVQFGRYAAEQKTWKLAGWSFTGRSVSGDGKVSGTPTQKPLEPGHYGIFEFDCNLRTPIIMGGRPLAVFDVQAGRVNNLGLSAYSSPASPDWSPGASRISRSSRWPRMSWTNSRRHIRIADDWSSIARCAACRRSSTSA